MFVSNQKTKKTQTLKDEILEFNNKMSIFGISIDYLTSVTPLKTEDRKKAFDIVNFICDDDSLINYVFTMKKLPSKMIVESLKIKKSFLKKNKDYIIGLLFISDNKSSFLYKYIKDGMN